MAQTAPVPGATGAMNAPAPSPPPLTITEVGLKAAAAYSQANRGQAMLVMREGKVVFEQYDSGGSPDRRQMLASGSKSFVGLAAVAAVEDKILKLDDRVSEVIPEWNADPAKSRITYRHLLTLTSGLTAGERGAATRAPSWRAIADKPMLGKPGRQFEYGAYPLNTFAYALERKLKTETFEAYLKRRILAPIGITAEWRFRCDDGHPQVGGGAFVTARDWAKFGEFVRRGGTVDGRQIVSPALLAECFQGTPQNPAYGLTWWLKKSVSPEIVRSIPLLAGEWGEVANSPWLPGDLVAACGAGKQRLYVVPSLQLVIVRQGALSQSFSDLPFLQLLFRPPGASGVVTEAAAAPASPSRRSGGRRGRRAPFGRL
ncbi:MAG: beta-lactamase family protein [Cytophagales bacterium]|nr:beta-lactamase family protein [Armatimonadota bacterium]